MTLKNKLKKNYSEQPPLLFHLCVSFVLSSYCVLRYYLCFYCASVFISVTVSYMSLYFYHILYFYLYLCTALQGACIVVSVNKVDLVLSLINYSFASYLPKKYHILSHRVHLHACAKVSQLQVSVSVQQHVVGLNVSVDEAHGVNGIQSHHHFCCVELGPFLWYIISAGEVDQVTSWHVLHHHVEVVLILEGTA